ncbi:MAG TPA: hypothetical protein QGF35_04120 [Dehalococcoidia bacterium]|jgi:hypothetical protein|nr:hypothetical protein [Dehalococcoidia bacterium]
MTPEDPAQPQDKDEQDPLTEVTDLVKAVGLGLVDTFHDMLDAGREGARETSERYWRRFEEKTVNRRQKKEQ